MSLLQNLRSVFSRRKPEETPGSVGSAAEGDSLSEPVATPGTIATVGSGAPPDSGATLGSNATSSSAATPASGAASGSNDAEVPAGNVVNIYSHGFTNGAYRIEPDAAAFERFLEFCNESDRLREQRLMNKLAIARVQERLDGERVVCGVDRDLLVSKGREAGRLSTSMDELVGMRKNMGEKEAALVVRQRETVAEYAWVPSVLFLLAGGTFIAADISITKQITTWGFNMSGTQGWIYAVGLALTAFLIKPGIDRMLEKPFQSAGLQLSAVYKCFLIVITIAGLVMLYFLGRFRADSERARMQLGEIDKKMVLYEPRSEESKKLQEKEDEILRGLDGNSMGQNGLVLSGLLFAVGGAVCLSVSFGSLKQLINRYWILPVRIARVRRGMRVIGKRLDGMRAEHTLVAAEQEKAEKRLLASELTGLRGELDKLHAEELTLLSAFYQTQSERERALYRDGRSRGEKFQLDGELLYRVPGNDGAVLQLGNSNGVSASPRPYTRRPFVKMRKMIADQFNKNKNNQPYDDGTEFEIVA